MIAATEPRGVPFTIEVTVPGYETWRYSKYSSGKPITQIQLKQGSIKELTIALLPLK